MGMPSFYKIMKDDYTQKIQIPRSFLKHFKGVLPRECVLRNPVGRSWVIKLVEVDRCLFFNDSWGNFVQDHSLEWGDFIMFTCEGSFEFHVNVFEKKGCEMDYAVASENGPEKVGEKVSNNSSGNGTNEGASSNLKSKTLFRQEMEDDLVVEVSDVESDKKNGIVIPESLGSRMQRNGNQINEAASSNIKRKTLARQEMDDELVVEVLDVVAEPNKKNGIVIPQSLGSCKQRNGNRPNEAASSNLKRKTLTRQEMDDELVVETLDVAEPNKKNGIVIPQSLGSCKQRNGNRTNEAATSNLKRKTVFRQEMDDDLLVEVLDVVAEPKKENGIVIPQSLGSRKQIIKTPTNEAASSSKVAQQRDNRTVHRDKQPKKVGVLQKENSHSSKNLSFSMTMRPSYISPRAYLHIPTKFSRSYFTQNMEEVVLLVSGGKVSGRWVVNYFSNNSAFAAGWSTFARENHLKVDDVCSFEAVVPTTVKTLNVVIHRKS